MAIGTNDLIDKFGTQDTVTVGTGTSAVTNGSFSAAADVVAGGWTNDDDAPLGAFVLTCQFATLPVANSAIELFARVLNIDGTNDQPQPDSNYAPDLLGRFFIDAGTAANTDMTLPCLAALPNVASSQVYEFYLKNVTGQTISAGWVLKVTPITQGPRA